MLAIAQKLRLLQTKKTGQEKVAETNVPASPEEWPCHCPQGLMGPLLPLSPKPQPLPLLSEALTSYPKSSMTTGMFLLG